MLPSMSWGTMDHLVRDQLRVFSQIGEQMRLREEDRRRVLLLSEREWADWVEFLEDGPLPARPHVPVMLCRIGKASHRLAVIAERQGLQA